MEETFPGDIELVRQLAATTISKLKDDKDHCKSESSTVTCLTELPALPMRMIFSLVASRTFNKAPRYHEYLNARSRQDYEVRQEKNKAEYSVKNLMMLRRVCTKFEHIINNMVPMVDYEPIGIDVKLQGILNSREVKFFKYRGTGSRKTCTRLTRIRRFNENNEHIENFEKIESLYIVDMSLTEELFETILQLNLQSLKKMTFERIQDVRFNEDVDVPAFIQQFLDSLESSPLVFFNSDHFDPNVVLFTAENGEEPMDVDVSMELQKLSEVHRHRTLRLARLRNDPEFRKRRTNNIASSHLCDESLILDPALYRAQSNRIRLTSAEKMKRALQKKTGRKSAALQKAGRFHLRKALALLEKRPLKSRSAVYFHLKMLKKISGMDATVTEEEKSHLEFLDEEKARRELLSMFPFLSNMPTVRRQYTVEERIKK